MLYAMSSLTDRRVHRSIRWLAVVCLLSGTTLRAQGAPAGALTLTLGEAARLAARQNLSSQAALLRADAADTRVAQRRADLLPNLTGLAETNSRTFNSATLGISFPAAPGQQPFFDPNGEVIGPVPTTDFRARLQQNLYDPAVNARLRLARQQAVASRSDAAQVGAGAATQAALAYVRVLRADAVFTARAADSTLAADLLRIARETLRAGTGVALDVTRAESQLVSIRSQLIGARVERDKALLDLRRTLNLPYDQRIQLADALDTDDLELPVEAAAITQAMARRPDVAALDAQLVAARLSERAVRAERLPSISAVADNGFIGKSPANLLNTWTWGVRVSVPAFDGWRREARVREQGIAERELEARRSEIVAQVGVDVRSALLDAAAAREVVAAAQERVRLAEQEVSQARDRFTAGVSGNLDVTQALLGLSAARTQLVDAQASRQLARISIARSQGVLTSLR
jgi:outer membrane protein